MHRLRRTTRWPGVAGTRVEAQIDFASAASDYCFMDVESTFNAYALDSAACAQKTK